MPSLSPKNRHKKSPLNIFFKNNEKLLKNLKTSFFLQASHDKFHNKYILYVVKPHCYETAKNSCKPLIFLNNLGFTAISLISR